MIDIHTDDVIKAKVPELMILKIEADVINGPTPDELWNEISATADSYSKLHSIETVNKSPAIKATREAYKKLGKDPNRYRPSAEALCRRIVNGKGLYRLSVLVDLINLISIRTGHSIGGFDADKICSDSLTLGVGSHDDEFMAIGRGPLNIEGLPVYRDEIGGIGTPTSDCERTKLTEQTRCLLMIVNMYAQDIPVDDLTNDIIGLLRKYAAAGNIDIRLLKVSEI